MSVRVYLPTTVRGLATAVRDGEVRPVGGTAFAVTPSLAASAPGADTEELEYLAMSDAARASLRLIAGSDPALPALRVVIAADVAGEVRYRDDLDRAAATLSGPVPWGAVASVHLDGADAAEAVSAAATSVDAADMGDLDAEFVVGTAEDFELAWYAPNEIVYLLAELGWDEER